MQTNQITTSILRLLAGATIAFCTILAHAESGPVQLRSVNFPDRYVRHSNGVGALTTVTSDLDKKDSSFMLRPGLAGQGVSFESVNFPGQFLRHQNGQIKLNKAENSDIFKKDATFLQKTGLSGKGVSFESVNFPGSFLRHCNSMIFIDNAKGGNKACNPDPNTAKLDVSFELVGGGAAPAVAPPQATSPTPTSPPVAAKPTTPAAPTSPTPPVAAQPAAMQAKLKCSATQMCGQLRSSIGCVVHSGAVLMHVACDDKRYAEKDKLWVLDTDMRFLIPAEDMNKQYEDQSCVYRPLYEKMPAEQNNLRLAKCSEDDTMFSGIGNTTPGMLAGTIRIWADEVAPQRKGRGKFCMRAQQLGTRVTVLEGGDCDRNRGPGIPATVEFKFVNQ